MQGMGGQLGYCGMWLSGEFDHGHSQGRPQCTTYGSPSLSSTEEFTVDIVEAWHVGPPPTEEQVTTIRPPTTNWLVALLLSIG